MTIDERHSNSGQSEYVCCLPGCGNRQGTPLNWDPNVLDEKGVVIFHCDACGERIWVERAREKLEALRQEVDNMLT